MASIECKCGDRLSDTEVPSEVVLHQYTDFEMHNILRDDSIDTIELAGRSTKIWQCPKCHRLYMFNETGRVIKIYSLELVTSN